MNWEMIEDYFFLNVNEYFDGVNFPINLFIISISIGICIAIFFITAHNRYTYLITKQLLRHEARDEESAKTLSQMHISPSMMLKSALSRHGQLTLMVKRVLAEPAEEQKSQNEKIDFSTARFYLGAENIDRARRINEGTAPTYFHAILFSVMIIAIAVILSLFMPEILSLLSGM